MKILILSLLAITLLVQPAFANENLFVSRDIAEKEIAEKLASKSENVFPFSGACTSFAPLNYDHKNNYFYFDQLSPTFDVGFFKNEFPLVIDSTSFTKSDFLDKSKTVSLETDNPVSIEILLFENRGPQNIQNITLYTNLQESFSIDKNTPRILLEKDPPEPVSDPIQYYIRGQIEEDFGQSYRYDTPWASYTVSKYDPDNLLGNVTSSFSKENYKLKVVFEFTFEKHMPKSNLVLTASDVKGNTMTCHILDAISVSDNETLPQWFENNLRWYDEGKISKAELENAIKYLEAKSLHVENTDKCYREKFPIDWSGCDLYGKVLPDIDYRYANLSNANLAGAIFSGKDLSNADLSGAFLKYAEIDNANLTNADLSNASIIRGWVRGSDLSNANLSGAYLWNTDFTSSNLTNVNFQDATLTYAILAGTDLKDANLDGAGTWSTNLNDCYNHPICE